MAFRAYDPLFACATHYAIGKMPLRVKIYNNKNQLLKTIDKKIQLKHFWELDSPFFSLFL
jgi:hypothetical protein